MDTKQLLEESERSRKALLSLLEDQKLAQEELKKSKALYQDLVETSQDLIWQCDAEGRYTYLNPAWEETFGYKVEEMLGRRFSDFQSKEYAERDLKEFGRLMQSNFIKGYETVHLGKDGRKIHLVFTAKFLRDRDGNIAGTLGSAHEITERKKTEQALRISENQHRIFAELTSDYVYVFHIDPTGQPVLEWISDAFVRIMGYTFEEFRAQPV